MDFLAELDELDIALICGRFLRVLRINDSILEIYE